MLKVSRAVAQEVKVLLTGDGGDDVFLGYPSHRNLWLATKFSKALPPTVKSAWRRCSSLFPRIGPLRRAAALFDYTTGNLGAFFGGPNDSSLCSAYNLLGDRLRNRINRTCGSQQMVVNHQAIEDVLSYERKTRFVGEYMTKIDGATMHYGLEARSPFLDAPLWEFASALSFDVRLHGWHPKAILRELTSKRISRNVARRRKRGFGIPVQRWIVGRWRPQIEAAFHDSLLDREGWISADSVLTQLEVAGRNGWASEQLWYLFVLESWMKNERDSTRAWRLS
jgi:asparagine synthase (glutamine-hydrolysing)